MTVKACAHRGDSSRITENTKASIASAIALGAEIVEIDVRVTSDGHVVVLHDPTLERIWGLPKNISDVTLAEVLQLGYGDNRIPLLADVAAMFEGANSTLMIDMEVADPAAAAYEVVKDSKAKICWCGDLDGMKIIRALDPTAEIWMPWNVLELPTQADIAELKPAVINSNYSYLSKQMVEAIHALGCRAAAWTIDDLPTMRWAISIGVDSITTNELSALLELRKNPGPVSQESELDLAVEVSTILGNWAVYVMSQFDPGEIEIKENPADLVTEIDVMIERHVREMIAANFHNHAFVGEEMGGEYVSDRPCWYLDPVDGTTNFANRLPWNAFSLALLIAKEPQVAIVADPWRDEIFTARKDRGAYLNGRELTVSKISSSDPLAGKVVLTELAAYQAWPGMLNLLQSLADRFCTMRIMGSGTMTLVGIAANRGVGAVVGEFGPVDHLAAVLIVKEAGGLVLDEAGNENLFPASGGVMVANPAAASDLHKIWIDAIRS